MGVAASDRTGPGLSPNPLSMEEEKRAVSLFEVFWFYHKIFPKPPPFSRPTQEKTHIKKPNNSHLQSLSHELSSKSDPLSPNSVLPTPQLISRETEEVTTVRKKRGSKSLSDLELQELKGIFDLGFRFLDGEMDSRLVSIVPGLQRLRKKEGEEKEEAAVDESAVSRPYLSEAWSADGREENPMMKWRVPAVCYGDDMKHHLRSWAQAVASTVR